MRSLRQLLESPTLAPLLGYLVRPELDPMVERVALIEEPREVGRVGEHAIVLLTRAASVTASTYRFDIALRVARTRRSPPWSCTRWTLKVSPLPRQRSPTGPARRSSARVLRWI
jgi:hypothetical protein